MSKSKYRVAAIAGDGIGPEIMEQALLALNAAAAACGFAVDITHARLGGDAIDADGRPLPQSTLQACRESDAALLGAVGGPKWDSQPPQNRPEAGLLGIRSALGLYANLRPAVIHAALRGASPLKDEILGERLDIMIVRELTGGIYFGARGRSGEPGSDGETAFDTETYSRGEIRRICSLAFGIARRRGKKLCSVDKANVLESSRLWRETVSAMACDYPDVELTHMYVDNAAMQLARNPRQFDTIVTGNMFGDILSDEASQVTGSIGMLPSASLGDGDFGLYEPIHGSAPDIAGKDAANPIAAILSAAMMLRHSLDRPEAARLIEAAVTSVLESGLRTPDIAPDIAASAAAGTRVRLIGTREMGESVAARIHNS